MNSHVFTIRDLEEVRRRNRQAARRRSHAGLRDYLITFAMFAAAWLAREILL